MTDYTYPESWLADARALSTIPLHMHEGLKNYVVHGIPPGGFLTAVLENKLVESFAKADDVNQRNMLGWVNFLYGAMPVGSWGSEEAVAKWIKRGGLKGRT